MKFMHKSIKRASPNCPKLAASSPDVPEARPRSLTTSPDEPADHARAGSSCRPWPDQGEGCRMGCGRAWTAFGPGRETSLSFRHHSQPGWLQAGVKSESVLVSRAARNWRPPVRRSRRHRPPPFGLPCRTRPFLRGPLLPGQPRFPFPAVACFPAPKGLRLAELGTCGERPPGKACGTLGRGPCSRPFPVCVRLFCSHM